MKIVFRAETWEVERSGIMSCRCVKLQSSCLFSAMLGRISEASECNVSVLTWNLREGDAETADLADVHGRLQQRLDGVQLRVRRVVVLCRYYRY